MMHRATVWVLSVWSYQAVANAMGCGMHQVKEGYHEEE